MRESLGYLNIKLTLELYPFANFVKDKLIMDNSAFKILLVDDEPDIVEFLSYNLKKEGYQVLTASNGKDAITIAKREVPHLIVLDVMMPDMDGIETCREIREQKGLQEVIIAFLTARSEDYTQIAGF